MKQSLLQSVGIAIFAISNLLTGGSHLVLAQAPSSVTAAAPDATVKVCAVQLSGYDKSELPHAGRDPAQKIIDYINVAGQQNAQLVVFPEYVLGHISVPGPETERIGRAAAHHRIYVIVGCWEEHGDGSFANTALVFDRVGRIAGKYQKTHAAVDQFEGDPPWSKPPRGKDRTWFVQNDPEWVMQRGDDLPVFEFDFGKVGILTCYDGWFPETARVLSLKGAELLVWINGRRGVVEDFLVKSVTFQSHVAMVTTNQAYGGGTMIAMPPARILGQCPDRKESLTVADIDFARIRRIRGTSRNFQQRRPDLYHALTDGAELITPTAAGSNVH